MKRQTIAFVGVFDLKNYGDHLFPAIFENEMRKRGLDYEIILFSNFECQQDFFGDKHVYSVNDLESVHFEKNIDAIILGGGEIIHAGLFEHVFENAGNKEKVSYDMLSIWLKPLLFSAKHKVKCIWNGVGIPFELIENVFLKDLISRCDYIAVRNEFSKKALKNIGITLPVEVIPDSAFLLDELDNMSELLNIRQKLHLPDKYIVFHGNKNLPDDSKSSLFDMFCSLKQEGYEIVFLPLAYTNEDDDALFDFAKELDTFVHVFEKQLSVQEIIAIFAGASLYIGLSFHGAISSLAYGKSPIMFDYYNQVKNVDLYNYIDLKECRVTKIDDLKKAVQIGLDIDGDILRKKLQPLKVSLKEHYNKLYTVLVSDSKNESIAFESTKILESLIRTENMLKSETTEKSQMNVGWMLCAQELQNKDAELQAQKSEFQKHSDEWNDSRRYYEETIENYIQLEKDYIYDLQNRLEIIEQQKKQLKQLTDERDALEQFRVEVINSKTFRLLHMLDRKRG